MMKKKTSDHILVVHIVFAIALASYKNVCAYDPDPLQDFCVATENPERKGVYVNGKFCKNPKDVTADDFFYPRIDIPPNKSDIWGSRWNVVDVNLFPGLNTLGVSVGYVEYAPNGVGPPHIHPRGSDIMIVQEGTLEVGFVTSNLDGNRLFKKTLKKGDVFAFPIGLVHFHRNVGRTKAVTYHAYGSQNPGVIVVSNAVFGSRPRIDPKILAKSFQVSEDVVKYLQSVDWNE